jgi:hypothetical protein
MVGNKNEKTYNRKLIILAVAVLFTLNLHAQTPINWTEKQLMEPSELSGIITSKPDSVIIISVGPFNTIPGGIHTGMAGDKEGIEKFKTQLSTIDKNSKIVIYCGCCPFEHCPNVRPALDALKEMNFTNYYLLNLPENIKINWIDKGYPAVQQ